MKKKAFKEEVILNITKLMLVFLPVSMITNYFNGRLEFAILEYFEAEKAM